MLAVLVLEGLVVHPGQVPPFASHGQLALPRPVAPLGVVVPDALHPEGEELLQVDLVAAAVVDGAERQVGRPDHPAALLEIQAVFVGPHMAGSRVLDTGEVGQRVVSRHQGADAGQGSA